MFVIDTKRLANMLELSERRVRQLKNDGIIKEHTRGSGLYDPFAAVPAYILFLRDKNGGSVDYNAERAKLIRAKRKVEEYELQLKEGELHKSEDIELIMGDMLLRFKARLMSIPAKASPNLAAEQSREKVYKMLKGYIDEALEELSDFKTAFQGAESEENAAEEQT